MIKVLFFFGSAKYFKYLKFQHSPKLHLSLTKTLKIYSCLLLLNQSHY